MERDASTPYQLPRRPPDSQEGCFVIYFGSYSSHLVAISTPGCKFRIRLQDRFGVAR